MDKIQNYKVTDAEIKEQGVQAIQGDVLYGEPDENKKIFDRLATFLIARYNATADWLVDKAHIHDNKDLIDTIAEENVHAHENKALIDTIETDNVHSHGNKEVIDTIQVKNVHEHGNKTALDTITLGLINAWNNSAGIPGGKIIDVATDEQAQEGVNNEVVMTPYLVKKLYYQKLDTYTKTEIDAKIAAAIEEEITSVLEGSF